MRCLRLNARATREWFLSFPRWSQATEGFRRFEARCLRRPGCWLLKLLGWIFFGLGELGWWVLFVGIPAWILLLTSYLMI